MQHRMTITLEKAVQGLQNAVRIKGANYRPGSDSGEGGCTYARWDGNGMLVPVCIVGHFFHQLGLLGLIFWSDENAGYDKHAGPVCPADNEYSDLFTNTLAAYGIEVAPAAAHFMHHAQSAQDGGAMWGDAVREGLSQTEQYLRSTNPEFAVIERAIYDLPEVVEPQPEPWSTYSEPPF